ncbi:damage-inducible protein CinA [Rhodonellum psychrophilum GCM71 = DSM 17998]|uniref:CinA-like protein n=2 Tax=Rhodonellum TaxID=336827 RepID=U5C3B4_9BACT|nr:MULTISPECIES: competence/damage-inducible protein A [Rhodonellum]ERM84553.1 damage-inducible protein CinA [Rhodonellum psychrophilum GCM71 = DSM 17998]MDO9554825.1 competence/damage-inducible protein A [Rhodonellum sp.]SDY84998.1 competence/damage-inducible protein cinA [Rhodonellum ikkaensis]
MSPKREIKAEIIAIGDELLYGQIIDTNSHWISQELDLIGVRVVRRTTVGDNRTDILSAFQQAEQRADIILMTGGLGPTNDDLTKPLLAEYFKCGTELVPEALEAVRTFFEKRGRELTLTNQMQAYLPTKCQYVPNEVGTAPGMWFEENGCVWMSMPGVPHEMKKLMTDFVLPKVKSLFELPTIFHRVIRTVGIGESWLADLIKNWEESLPSHIRLAYLPSLGQVRMRLTAFGDDLRTLQNEVDLQIETVKPLIDKYIYGYDQESLEEAIGRLLKQENKKIALAESCSGGYISHLITSIPGSSAYFQGAVVPYHNTFKNQILGVNEKVLEEFGAVSEQTIIEMAENIRTLFQADYGLASSGIAGPGGGWAEKPVGTVWIACAFEGRTVTKKLQLTQDRMLNIQLTGVALLNLFRTCILEKTE